MDCYHSNTYADLLNSLAKTWDGLPDKPDETPESTLAALCRFVAGPFPPGPQMPPLGESQATLLKELVDRRMAGEPLAYLLGHTIFMGIEFQCGPDAMIPRAETELLASAALQLLQELTAGGEAATILDLCAGSGNVGLALIQKESRACLHGSDISANAVSLAKRNAERLGLEARADFICGDLLEPFRDRAFTPPVGLITCNPPYISSGVLGKLPREILEFEPRAAFDGGPFGLSILMKLVKEAHSFLRRDGWVICETGLGQGDVVAGMFRKSPAYRTIATFEDARGQTRVVAAQV